MAPLFSKPEPSSPDSPILIDSSTESNFPTILEIELLFSCSPPIVGAAAYHRAQIADQPWIFDHLGNALAPPYTPTVVGKWWSPAPERLDVMARGKRQGWSHIGRIMETELGHRLDGNARCSHCQKEGNGCWVYNEEGRHQISHPGTNCARCRVSSQPGGCSLSTRRGGKKRGQGPRQYDGRVRALAPLRTVKVGNTTPPRRLRKDRDEHTIRVEL